MRLPGTSTLATSSALNDGMRTTRLLLENAQKEVSTGRHADVGLSLSFNVSRNLDWRLHLSSIEQSLDSSNQTLVRAEAAQSALGAAKSVASAFMNSLVGSRGAQNGQYLIKQSAGYAIDSVHEAINVNYGGQYLFGGQNNSEPPFASFKGSQAEAAFDAAFLNEFGFPKADPATQLITPIQMRSFLEGSYENLFASGAWESNWSNASSTNIAARIGGGQLIDATANANEQSIKDIMKGMVAATEAGVGQLSQSTFQAVVDYSLAKIGTSIQGLGNVEARVGEGQHTISQSIEKLNSKKSILQGEINRTESIDQAEAVVRMNGLLSQMEANYAVTGKISHLSLLNYL
jgi:flagellar hook-associated protein 3 FlgL